MTITPEQLNQYQRQGFLVLKNFVSTKACDDVRGRCAELLNDFDPQGITSIFTTNEQNRIADEYFLESGDKIRFFFEEDAFLPNGALRHSKERSINKIGHALHDLDPMFDRFSRTPELKALVTALGIQSPLLIQSMYIFKQPEIGGEVACHQDSTFLYSEPANIVGLWFALEDATVENGCLRVIPAGHKQGLKSRWVRTIEGEMRFEILDPTPFADEQLIPLEVSKGTLILLNGLLPHKSEANRSSKSRHAYTLHVMDRACRYPETNWLQRIPQMPFRGFD